MKSQISVRQVGDVDIIDSSGAIELGGGSKILKDTISGLSSQRRKKVLLNLKETTYIDSSGIRELVSGFAKLDNSGAQLKLLVEKGGKIQDLVKITRLYTIMDVFYNEEEAIRSFAA